MNAKAQQNDLWNGFIGDLRAQEAELANFLKQTSVPLEKFTSVVKLAASKNMDLLHLDRRNSLIQQISNAAIDGLLPDGREGVLIPGSEQVYDREANRKKYILTVRWQPMVKGIRKRAWELDAIIIDAEVVQANDKFIWRQGDNPSIDHEPAPLGTSRGNAIGAYAIFKRPGDAPGREVILHREVMDFEQIQKVKECSKQQDGLMWTTFWEEAWRKSPLRRGIKSVPCSAKLETIIADRWDDDFDLNAARRQQPEASPASANVVSLPPVTARAAATLPPPTQGKPEGPRPAPAAAPAPEMPPVTSPTPKSGGAASQSILQPAPDSDASQGGRNGEGERKLLATINKEMTPCRTEVALQAVWDMYERDFEGRGREFQKAADALWEQHKARVKQGKAA